MMESAGFSTHLVTDSAIDKSFYAAIEYISILKFRTPSATIYISSGVQHRDDPEESRKIQRTGTRELEFGARRPDAYQVISKAARVESVRRSVQKRNS